MLRLRRDQLLRYAAGHDIGDLVHFVVVQPHDTVAAVEAAAGYPVVTEQAFEWVADHGGLFEAAAILSDDGFAVVLLVPDDPAIDTTLLASLRDQAVTVDADVAATANRERPAAA